MSAVAELPLDLDAFEGPFDLLLTLVLKEELELADVEIVEIVLTFLEERGEDRVSFGAESARALPGGRGSSL